MVGKANEGILINALCQGYLQIPCGRSRDFAMVRKSDCFPFTVSELFPPLPSRCMLSKDAFLRVFSTLPERFCH